jgi:hypothetical protein
MKKECNSNSSVFRALWRHLSGNAVEKYEGLRDENWTHNFPYTKQFIATFCFSGLNTEQMFVWIERSFCIAISRCWHDWKLDRETWFLFVRPLIRCLEITRSSAGFNYAHPEEVILTTCKSEFYLAWLILCAYVAVIWSISAAKQEAQMLFKNASPLSLPYSSVNLLPD